MTASTKLTARQQEILDLIRQAIATTGAPPTRVEIAAAFGFKSPNAAEDHLQALARKGVIELVGGTSRGIRLKSVDSLSSSALDSLRSAVSKLALPLVGRVAAGSPILAQEHIEHTFYVEEDLFSQKPDYLLKVRGMSMRDIGIMEGDLLAVKRSTQAHEGQIVVARIDGDVTVKRFHRSASRIELLPENPDFKPIIVTSANDFAIEGLAVGLIRNQLSH
ncbi:LexA repressor [Saezia sanguinis]|uniref:LexA repressor n=1 Tax=Saezia sanguinis TaxID=1965230 RepID=A0A433SFW5_9BURK|nr:transcriptional repressor LexA [Saezia sanguinis]RUS67633.1 LexA repressor [Saezia sanguinis]